MPGPFTDYVLFWRQFRRQFHTTGAVLPSGRPLGRALARFVGQATSPQRVLEVGPGTGAVTDQIARRLGPHDRLDLVEINDQFVRRLNQRLQDDPLLRPIASRTRVLHCAVEQLSGEGPYDLIVSGLPLNNFTAPEVRGILDSLVGLLAPGGRLSFFEYIAIRRARALVSGRAERERLRGIGQAMQAVLGPYGAARDRVLRNVPPAWVHHVRLDPGHVQVHGSRS